MHSNYEQDYQLDIYRMICKGINYVKAIVDCKILSNFNIIKTIQSLIDKGIIEAVDGTRIVNKHATVTYVPSHKFYSCLIDTQSSYFSVISVSSSGKAIDRFDYKLDYEGKTKQEVFDNYVLNRIFKTHGFEKYCTNVFLTGKDTSDLIVSGKITKISKEEIIAKGYSKNNKTIMFDFVDKYILSLRNVLSYPECDKKAVYKIFEFDEIYEINKVDDFVLYDAISKQIIKDIENFI